MHKAGRESVIWSVMLIVSRSGLSRRVVDRGLIDSGIGGREGIDIGINVYQR
jgi:hypothetical protein